MKNSTKLLFTALIVLCLSTAAYAGCPLDKNDTQPCKHEKKEAMEVELYAHPTFFGDETQTYVQDNKNYVVGNGKVFKAKNKVGVKNKENVYVGTFAKDILDLMRDKQFPGSPELFNPKAPVLRSELAVALTEGLGVKGKASNKNYTDVGANYWAKPWIDAAYAQGMMIGYPDDSFKPDCQITKAEVFAVMAQMINVAYDKSSKTVVYNGKVVQYIPNWAVDASKEAVASKLLEKLPEQSKIVNSEYLSKEQVAYLVGALRNDFAFYQKLGKDKNAPDCIRNYNPVILKIELTDRLSAKHSNIGQKFTAKTTDDVNIGGVAFPAGSTVKGEVIAVQRPGVCKSGYLRVKFTEIVCGNEKAEFPKNVSEAEAAKIKNPNFVARLFGMPFTGAGRVIGVAGRTVGTGVNVIANDVEKIGDNVSNTFVDTLSLQPISGLKNLGGAFVAGGQCIYDLGKLLVSGIFGILYEITDEIVYLILPCKSNDSSLNPGEELVIIY